MVWTSLAIIGVRVPKNEPFLMCEAPAHVMDHQSGSQGYKTFQWGLFMFVIRLYTTILRWFMSKKNICTHDAALAKNMANTMLR